jgi:hypothetical protein
LFVGQLAPAQVFEKGFSFVKDRKVAALPFKLVNNLIILPVFVNGSDTLHFILDTGIKTALLTSLGESDSLSLHTVKKVSIQGWGNGEALTAWQSYGNTFNFSNAYIGKNIEMYVLESDIFSLSTKLGMKVHGLIGHDFFKDCIVEIDYDNRLLKLHNRKKFKHKKLKGTLLPFALENGKPYIHATVTQDDSSQIALKLVVDTGASHSLSLDIFSNATIKLPEKTIDSYLGKGMSGDIRGKIGRVQQLHIANYDLKDLTTSYPDSIYTRNVAGLSQRNGSLGSDILRRFHVFLDYHEQKMWLSPNKKFDEPFNYNMSGIDIYTPYPNLPCYIISDIADNSPAKEVGLQPNDQILYINGTSVADLSLDEIITLFNSKQGKKITITVKRNETTVKKTIILKRAI